MNDKSKLGILLRAFAEILLIGFLVVAANAANDGDDLPCDLTLPDGTPWHVFFDSAGSFIQFDDECG